MTDKNTAPSPSQKNYENRSGDEKKNSSLTPVYFGVEGRPFPVLEMRHKRVAKNKDSVAAYEWRVYEDDKNPLTIHSELGDAEVMGLLFRNLPKPSMLEIFLDGLKMRLPSSKRRCEFVKGYPGAGKTFMAMLHSSLKTKKSPIVIDCGGRNLQDLLWETVLDFDGDSDFYSALEIRAAKGELHDVSIKILSEALGKAFHVDEETGRAVFDWDKIGTADTIEGAPDNHMEKIKHALMTVRQFEGLESKGGSALGLKMVPGAIFQAFHENVPLILDEYNKSKIGTDDCMQTVLQFLNGERDEVTVHSPLKNDSEGGMSYTLKRSDMGDLFFVTATGNAVVDGVSTRELSESANQRWDPVSIPKSTYEDWLHAWTQFTTGVPISTLYQTGFKDGENQWDKNPDDFRTFLYNRLTDGKSDIEIASMPEEYTDFINNWRPVLNDLQKAANFCHRWSHMLDPDNMDLEGVSEQGVLEEIEEPEYRQEVGMGYRKIIKWIEKVRLIFPGSKSLEQSQGYDVGRYNKPVERNQSLDEPVSLNYGTRMRQALIDDILKHTLKRGKKHTYKQLMSWAEQDGIHDVSMEEGKKQQGHLFGHGLDVSPFQGHDDKSRALIIQKQLANHLRDTLPKYKDQSDNELIPIAQVKALLVHLQGLDDVRADDPRSNDILFINPSNRTFVRRPFADGRTVDTTPVADENGIPKTGDNPPASQNLIDEKSFLNTLIMPVIGALNLRAVWNKAISTSGLVAVTEQDKHMAMAENSHDTDMAITTIMVSSDDNQEVPVHLIKNNRTGRVLVIGNQKNDSLRKNFMLSRMDYIDRNHPNAKRLIRAALNDLVGDGASEHKDNLRQAFLLRNHSTLGAEQEQGRSLEDLLASPDVECFNKHYLTKRGGRLLKPKVA